MYSSTMAKSREEMFNEAHSVAAKSSISVMPIAPSTRFQTYPLPDDLKTAVELSKDDPLKLQRTFEEWKNNTQLTVLAREYMRIVSNLQELKDIRPEYYWFTMKLLLYIDNYKNMANMDQFSLYEQKITRSKWFPDGDVFVIYVPGLSEDRPSVRPHDVIIINQTKGDNNCISQVFSVGKNYITAGVNKKFIELYHEDQLFNIFFLYPEYCFRCMHNAVDRALMFDLQTALFPLNSPVTKVQHRQQLSWINNSMKSNPEQQQAVVHILARTSFPSPYIVFGPPGTGKTSTLVEAICQILRKNPSNRILICTPSNAAADEIALRLLKNDVPERNLHRMYSLSRSGNDISETLKLCSNFSEDKSLIVPEAILKNKKIVITTLMTCHRLIGYALRENHFSYVFIDEAGQATEPETLIPITLLSSRHPSYNGRIHAQVVIAGDPKQLGPSVQSRLAEPLLGCSMLERLMNTPIYSKNENNEYNSSYVTKLVLNYRCNANILKVPNELFYDGELKAIGGAHTERALRWHKLPNPDFPLIFHAVDGEEERDPRSPSVFNSKEVEVVISYVKDLMKSSLGGRKVTQDEIGIVTPYRLQKQKICDKLKNAGYPNVAVGTVETFQGQEKDVVIMTTVRSLLYRHDSRVHIGFLSNAKRFNVAITRAKALLILVGNPTVLQVDDNWRYFIQHCINNNACKGFEFTLKRTSVVSKMRSLFAKKHETELQWKPNMTIEIDEEAPRRKEFQLPNKDAQRRRRFPRLDATNDDDHHSHNNFGILNTQTHHVDLWDLLSRGDDPLSSNYEKKREDGSHDEDEDSLSIDGIFSEEDESLALSGKTQNDDHSSGSDNSSGTTDT